MHLLPMGLNILHAQFDFPTCIFIKMWTWFIVSSVLHLHFEHIVYFKGTSLLSRGEDIFPSVMIFYRFAVAILIFNANLYTRIRVCALDDRYMDGIRWLKKTRRGPTIDTRGPFVYNLRSGVLEDICLWLV